MDDKHKILNYYHELVSTYDRAELLALYLKKIIQQIDPENEMDMMELEFDLQKITTLYHLDNEKIHRLEKELDRMMDKYNVQDLELSSDDFVAVSTRIFNYLQHEDNRSSEHKEGE